MFACLEGMRYAVYTRELQNRILSGKFKNTLNLALLLENYGNNDPLPIESMYGIFTYIYHKNQLFM